MKLRALALLLLMFLAGGTCNSPVTAGTYTVSGTYVYVFLPTAGGIAVCSTTITTTCVQAFTLLDVSNPAAPVSIATIGAPGLSFGPIAVTLSFGPHVFAYEANCLDGNGNAITSPLSTNVTVSVAPPAPTNPSVTVTG
jgi:hypothetical protein